MSEQATHSDFQPDQGNTQLGAQVDKEALMQASRIVEALLFASAEPLKQSELASRIDQEDMIDQVMEHLAQVYATRGVNLLKVDDCWAFRTAQDLSFLMQQDQIEVKKLSRAALEVLAIAAYHQPVTRAEIEEIRGVATSKGTLDLLLETGWLRMRGRRKTPGRPVTYGTTLEFLDHFSLENIKDLPGLEELKGTGLLQARVPSDFQIPMPNDDETLHLDEDPLEQSDFDFGLLSPLDADNDEGKE